MCKLVEPCTITVRLKPRARKESITVDDDGSITASVTSPAIENRANMHLIKLLAKQLRCPQSNLQIIKGEHCRQKVIACEGFTSSGIHDALNRVATSR